AAVVRLAEAGEGEPADGERLLEAGDGVGAVVPQVGARLGSSRRPRVLIGKEDEAAGEAVARDGVERRRLGGLRGAGRELAVAPADGLQIPGPHPYRV